MTVCVRVCVRACVRVRVYLCMQGLYWLKCVLCILSYILFKIAFLLLTCNVILNDFFLFSLPPSYLLKPRAREQQGVSPCVQRSSCLHVRWQTCWQTIHKDWPSTRLSPHTKRSLDETCLWHSTGSLSSFVPWRQFSTLLR